MAPVLIAECEGGMFRHYRPRYATAPIKVYANGRISDAYLPRLERDKYRPRHVRNQRRRGGKIALDNFLRHICGLKNYRGQLLKLIPKSHSGEMLYRAWAARRGYF